MNCLPLTKMKNLFSVNVCVLLLQMEREARKASKRANKKANSKSLQENQQNDDNRTEPSSKHKITSPHPLTHSEVIQGKEATEANGAHDAELLALEGLSVVAPATCETPAPTEHAPPDTYDRDPSGGSDEPQSKQSPSSEHDVEIEAPSHCMASENESSDPQPNTTYMAASPLNQEMLFMAEQSQCTLEPSDFQAEEVESKGLSGDHTPDGAAGPTEADLQPEIAQPVLYEADSLLKSLERFCAVEYLIYENKFACTHCTTRLAEEEKLLPCIAGMGDGEALVRLSNDEDLHEKKEVLNGSRCGSVGSDREKSSSEESVDEEEVIFHEGRDSRSEQNSVESEGWWLMMCGWDIVVF